MFIRVVLLSGLIWFPATSFSQQTWIGGSSDYFGPQAFFNEVTGILTIPSLQIFMADDPGGVKQAAVTLEQSGTEHFAVKNYREITRPPVCTDDEILAAIPQVTLQTTFEEVSALFSCSPRTSAYNSSDLEEGKRVTMSWIAGDSTSSSSAVFGDVLGYSPFFVTSTTGNISSFHSIDNRLISSGAQASVSLTFLEGVLESFSYSKGSPDLIEFCDSEQLAGFLQSLTTGVSLETINEQLGCDGTLIGTIVSAVGKQDHYSWHSQPLARTNNGAPVPFPRTIVSLSGVFSENKALTLSGSYNETLSPDTDCSVEELADAASALVRGMDEADLLDTIACDYSSKQGSYSTDGNNSAQYIWSTSVPNSSIFLSPNRQLLALIREGSVLHFSLSRH